jgi:septal ring factor EnvC (AmiA/AmiB activator)
MNCRGLTWDEDRTKTLLEQTESMLLLPEKSLSQETLAIACLVWAQAHIVSLMPYKKAQLRIEELQEAIEDVKKENSKLKAALTKSKNS